MLWNPCDPSHKNRDRRKHELPQPDMQCFDFCSVHWHLHELAEETWDRSGFFYVREPQQMLWDGRKHKLLQQVTQ